MIETGAETIGITMHLAGSRSRCCSLDDVEDARRVAADQDDKAFTALVIKHCSDACRKRATSACTDVCSQPKDYIRAHISAASLKSPPIPKECRRSCLLKWPQACDAGCRAQPGDVGMASCLGIRSNCDKPCGQEQQKFRNRPLDMRRVFVQACSHGCKAGVKWSCGIAAEDRKKRMAMNA